MSDIPIIGTLDERLVTGEGPHRRGKSYPKPVIGEVWRDKDPRMNSGNRRVTITAVQAGRVFYMDAALREFSAKHDRFRRVFEPVVR